MPQQIVDFKKVARNARKMRVRLDHDLYQNVARLATERRLPTTAFIRSTIIEYMDENPLETLPPIREDQLVHLSEVSPNAIVYTVPIDRSKIAASEAKAGNWHGVIWRPGYGGEGNTWTSTNLNPPLWAKTPRVLKALAFVASRVDVDGQSVFAIPQTTKKVTARFVDNRWTDGVVIDTSNSQTQPWRRGNGWYALMTPGPFSANTVVRRYLNMLCCALTARDGGATADIPA